MPHSSGPRVPPRSPTLPPGRLGTARYSKPRGTIFGGSSHRDRDLYLEGAVQLPPRTDRVGAISASTDTSKRSLSVFVTRGQEFASGRVAQRLNSLSSRLAMSFCCIQ